MSGTVFLPDGQMWSASSSVFYWMVEVMAKHARNADLAARLREISEANLGGLEVNEIPEPARTELVTLIQRLPAFASAELPLTEHRHAIIAKMESLVEDLGSARSGPYSRR